VTSSVATVLDGEMTCLRTVSDGSSYAVEQRATRPHSRRVAAMKTPLARAHTTSSAVTSARAKHNDLPVFMTSGRISTH
jgi:hypothetical protein